jgi:hypothetical protein
MAGAGDYVYYQRLYPRVILNKQILSSDTTASLASLITTRGPKWALFIQKILFNPTTYSAQKWTFQDTSNWPILLGAMSFPATDPTTAGQTDQYYIDHGPLGYQCGLGQALSIITSGGGIVGALHIEGYQRIPEGVSASVSDL